MSLCARSAVPIDQPRGPALLVSARSLCQDALTPCARRGRRLGPSVSAGGDARTCSCASVRRAPLQSCSCRGQCFGDAKLTAFGVRERCPTSAPRQARGRRQRCFNWRTVDARTMLRTPASRLPLRTIGVAIHWALAAAGAAAAGRRQCGVRGATPSAADARRPPRREREVNGTYTHCAMRPCGAAGQDSVSSPGR